MALMKAPGGEPKPRPTTYRARGSSRVFLQASQPSPDPRGLLCVCRCVWTAVRWRAGLLGTSGHPTAAYENTRGHVWFALRSTGMPGAREQAAWAAGLPGSRCYLGLHQPARDGCFPIVAWPELQGHGAGADVGNAQVGGGPWEFWKTAWERRSADEKVPSAWTRTPGEGLCVLYPPEVGLGAGRASQGQGEADWGQDRQGLPQRVSCSIHTHPLSALPNPIMAED